jgi:hypothetical protein
MDWDGEGVGHVVGVLEMITSCGDRICFDVDATK